MFNRIFGISVLGFGLLVAIPGGAFASSITINFSGLSEGAQVAQFYDGGTSSAGDGPGPNDGVTFTPAANASITTNFGPPLLFFNNISDGGDTPLTINVASGFTGELEFQYAEPYEIATGSVTIYDANGNALATTSLPRTPGGYGYGYNAQQNPETVLSFSGTAQYVTFMLVGGAADLGSITFTPDPAAPEPASFGMGLVGLAALMLFISLRRHRVRMTSEDNASPGN